MSTASITFRSALWNHIGRILEYVLMYLTSILIARGLGVEENGRFVGLFSVSQLLLVLSSVGLETSLNKFIPQLLHENILERTRFILRRLLAVRTIAFLGVASLFVAVLFMAAIPLGAERSDVLLIVLLFAGIRSVAPLFAMVLTAQLQTHVTARINLIIRAIELAAVFLLLGIDFSVPNLFVLFLSTSVLHVVLYATASRQNLLGTTAPVAMAPIIRFGGVFWANTIVDFVLGRQGDILFLTNLAADKSQAGLYDVAFSIVQLGSMGMTVGLSGVTFATFARLAVENQGTMDRFYGFSIRILSLLTIPLCVFLLFHSADVIDLLYTQQYIAATTLVQGILIFRIFSRVFGGPENAEYLLSNGRVEVVVIAGIAAAIVNIALNVLLIPRFGAFGAVIASGSGNVLVNASTAFVVYRISSNRIQLAFWVKLTTLSLAAALATLLLPASGGYLLFVSALLFTLVLVALLTVMKPLTAEDTEWLLRADVRYMSVLKYFSQGSAGKP